jgi:cytoskeletal protein CcmA (bactofilin family)
MRTLASNRKEKAMEKIMEDIKTVIAEDVEINGSIKCTGGIRLGGKVNGDVTTAGDVLVEKTSAVKGNMAGNSIVVMGLIKGNITAKERIELKGSAKVAGDIKAKRLVVEEGVTLVGKMEIIASENSSGEMSLDMETAPGAADAAKSEDDESKAAPGMRGTMDPRTRSGQLFARK